MLVYYECFNTVVSIYILPIMISSFNTCTPSFDEHYHMISSSSLMAMSLQGNFEVSVAVQFRSNSDADGSSSFFLMIRCYCILSIIPVDITGELVDQLTSCYCAFSANIQLVYNANLPIS